MKKLDLINIIVNNNKSYNREISRNLKDEFISRRTHKIKVDYNNYNFCLYDSNIENMPSVKLPFSKEKTRFAILLNYFNNKKNKNKICALCSFNVDLNNNFSYCYNIQGLRNRYKELTPIHWDLSLVDKLIEFSKNNSLEYILLKKPNPLDYEYLDYKRVLNRHEKIFSYFGFESIDYDSYKLYLK